MIIENVKITDNNRKFLTRICDECGKVEKARSGVILHGRRARKKDIDLCLKCSNLKKYALENYWKSGDQSHHWKGGKRKSRGGYRIYVDIRKWIYEHRMIVEKQLGRKLKTEETIHHIDGDCFNNTLSNLFLCANNIEHGLLHYSLEKVGQTLIGNIIWFDYKKKIYILNKIEKKINEIKYDLSFLRDKKIHIYKYKNHGGSIKERFYYNEKMPGKKCKYRKMYVSVAIMEFILKRPINKNENVHHLDNNSLNNNIDNLVLLSKSEHYSCHKSLQKCVLQLYKQGIVKFENGKYLLGI